MSESEPKKVTFEEFEEQMRDEECMAEALNDPNYGMFREFAFQTLTSKVLPQELYPRETLGGDPIQVAQFPVQQWYEWYVELLMKWLKSHSS